MSARIWRERRKSKSLRRSLSWPRGYWSGCPHKHIDPTPPDDNGMVWGRCRSCRDDTFVLVDPNYPDAAFDCLLPLLAPRAALAAATPPEEKP